MKPSGGHLLWGVGGILVGMFVVPWIFNALGKKS